MNLPDHWHSIPKIIIDILIGLTVVGAAFVLWQWYQDGGGFEAIYVLIGVVLAGLLWLRRQQDKQPSKPQTTSAAQLLTETSPLSRHLPPYASK